MARQKKTGASMKRKPGGNIDDLTKLSGGLTTQVGVLRGTGEHPNAEGGQTIAEIAWWNEFGTDTIPERPFLRSTVREHRYYEVEVGKALREVLKIITSGSSSDGGALGKKFLLAVGVKAAADIQQKIVDISSPPNAEYTKNKKGSSSPLQDTGILKKSIQAMIKKDTLI